MGINLDKLGLDILSDLKQIKPQHRKSNFGVITMSGDGIVRISGLSEVRYNELLHIQGGGHALALNLEVGGVGAIVLGGESLATAGAVVNATGEVVRVPVGNALLGRVVDPLGRPVDGRGEMRTTKTRPIESDAPAIIDRDKVDTPLQTGILAIDSMIPIGRGQRELIIGDRQTGKTAIAIDTILNQRGKDVICVYVAIGQKASTLAKITRLLHDRGALDYTVVVSSSANDSAALQYIAPFTGCAIAEEFMESGNDVLIVYDDLSKHAVAYRTISLLLKRPPGREAYPGDVFYLHSRLLERSAKLSPERGGGSLTALPIVETLAGDISAYIPTNVISITDGQIYLESDLFNAGTRPAVNVGLSVSRVGGSAQIPAIRALSGKLRIDLAQYRELAVFAQFGSDLDRHTQEALSNGQRLSELLKQEQYTTFQAEEMAALLYGASKNLMAEIPVKHIRAFRDGLIEYMHSMHGDTLSKIRKTGKLDDDAAAQLDKIFAAYCRQFLTRTGVT